VATKDTDVALIAMNQNTSRPPGQQDVPVSYGPMPNPGSEIQRVPGRRSSRRQRSDARHNRAAVLGAARADLREHGALSMTRVAEGAGLSRSTLYRHFPTQSSLEDALREEARDVLSSTVQDVVTRDRPPLAVLRRLVEALSGVAVEHSLDAPDALPPGAAAEDLGAAMVPTLERLVEAAELAPAPPPATLCRAAVHLLRTCLETGSAVREDPRAVEDLFRRLTEPLDQGLVLLDDGGALLSINPRARRLLDPDGQVRVGETLTEPRMPVLYEDGSPSSGTAYPVAMAVRTAEASAGVRGHYDSAGEVAWIAVDARPLRNPVDASPYAVLGILSDVTAQRDWELRSLRPAGELEPTRPVPLDVVRTLDEIPPHLFPEQFVSEARRVSGGPVALYVLDIDGTRLLRLAGPEEFPERLAAPLALGAEIAEDGIPELNAALQAGLPGVTVAPMWLRGRAIGVLLGLRAPLEPLIELGRLGAAAMELAGGYTDVIDAARRRKETEAAAELQQSLLPPRIARMGGGEVAGSVLPSYEVGGDWFDYVENRDGAWIAIADAVGKGATAGALGGIALAALRAARRSGQSLEEAARTMHEVVFDVGRPEFFVTAIVARWHAVYSVFSWINCGHPPPLVLRADGSVEQLMTDSALPLGLFEKNRRFTRHQRRLDDGERLILHSDGITARKTPDGLFGLDGIERAVQSAPGRSAAAIARAIQEAVLSAAVDPLQDDAAVVVLAPTRERERVAGGARPDRFAEVEGAA
jgi:AcrR family transcriptional regulator